MATIRAVFENGMFRPTEPVHLPEGTTVDVTPATTLPEQDNARRQVFEILSHSYETGDPEAAARHDEHRP